ncbi:glycoside hydrolase family 172 protein [Maribacter sp. 2304DJ31-5]|uniref:glycoside hydrolase family 172 protein n=1 Tax=Maribacter sp. 2304DJ31-5 TaxID=3386273 RepID=UPI0039BD5F63
MKKILLVVCWVCTFAISTAQEKTITMGTLLDEMYDRSTLAEWPDVEYLCKQSSSRDRSSKVANAEDGIRPKAPGKLTSKSGWFGNGDASKYDSIIDRGGYQEAVMLDVKGPGVVTRIWQAHSKGSYDASAILRIYIDDNTTPALEIINRNAIGEAGIAPYPFSFYAPEKAENYYWRGRNLMFPIPFQKSCRITYDGHSMYGNIGGGEANYYNINYRTYTDPVKVESFSLQNLAKYNDKIKEVSKKLLEKTTLLSGQQTSIAPEKKYTYTLKGSKAIDYFQMKLVAADLKQALRSVVLELEFDNKKTLWVPIGQFFGLGYEMHPHKTHYVEVTNDELMISKWVMPFKKSAKVTFHNFGDQTVLIDNLSINSKPYEFTKNTMYFHGTWREDYKQDGTNVVDGKFVTIQGKGIYVGDNLTIFNSGPDWWGEGDEKIYVDGETFPSHFGTGTEDYYGYAWCRPHPFSLPFVSQPVGSGNKTWGMTSNNRYRQLDAIPFKKSLDFDMEIFQIFRMPLNWSPATFYYAFSGAKDDIDPDINGVKRKVTTTLDQILDGFPKEYHDVEQKDGFPIIINDN